MPGTDDYFDRSRVNLLHAITQTGAIFLMTDLQIPNMPLAVFATEFLLDAQGNHHIEVIFLDEDGTRLLEPHYKLHYHQPKEDCFEGCQIDFREYIDKIKNADEKVSLGTSANYISQYFAQFCRNIICDPASLLGSLHFDGNLQFPMGAPYTKATIASWPASLNDLNEKIAQNVLLTKEDVRSYSKYLNSVITTSTRVEDLMEHFHLNFLEAEEVSRLANTYQVKKEIDKCNQMPSMVTLVKTESRLENKADTLKVYNSLMGFLQIKLLCLKGEELDQDPETWLISIEDEEGFDVHIDENQIFLTLPPQATYLDEDILFINPPEQTIVIPHESEINQLIDYYGMTLFQSVYHRALTFSVISTLEVKHRSCQVLDAFVLPYNPFYLLAAKSTVTSQ